MPPHPPRTEGYELLLHGAQMLSVPLAQSPAKARKTTVRTLRPPGILGRANRYFAESAEILQ